MTVDIRNPQGQPLTTSDRSNAVAESLRQIARSARFADRKKGITSYQSHVRRDRWIPILFLIFFVTPTLASATYYWLIASDRYVTEARFAIRPGIGGADSAASSSSQVAGDAGTNAGVSTTSMASQDTLIVANYILSRPMIEAMDRITPLRSLFSRDSIDWFSRFNPSRPIEWLVWYWQWRVGIDVAKDSGIVTVTVNAFDSKESYELTKALLAESERMVNEMSLRTREDALAESKRELAKAEERMAKIRRDVRDLRNRDGVLDASKANDANLAVIGQLRKTRIDLTVQMALLLRDLAPDRRQILDMKAQISDIDDNIARLERESANQDPERRKALADSLTQFEAYANELADAERYFGAILAAHERARIVAARQIEFLNIVVAPVMPQSPDQPRRILMTTLITAGAALAFALSVIIRRSMT